VIEGVAEIRATIEAAGIHLTPFEMMTVLAFQAFAQARVDVAVVEVGLGGRLDATNVLAPLVSVVTSIGLDHQAYLGPTLVDIAREKGGVIKPGTPVVIGKMAEESRAVLLQLAEERRSPVSLFGREFSLSPNGRDGIDYQGRSWRLPGLQVGLRGRFQYGNAAVAVAALEEVQSSFPVSEPHLRLGLLTTSWPGRLEVVSEQPLVILDGAHNPQAMQVLRAELPGVLAGKRARVLFSVMRDKDWRAMAPLLAEIASEVVVTRTQQPRAEDPIALQAVLAPFCPTRVIPEARTACRQLMAESAPEDAIVVCGSLFLVGEVYPLFAPLAPAVVSQGCGRNI
jgi:dihydrofolate synthase/folylpolyglutamate synthase